MQARVKQRLRILDFDIENRPLAYWYDGMTTAEVTAIAASWVGEDEVQHWALTRAALDSAPGLRMFKQLYDEADMVTGHYIIRHDLPILQGAMLEHGLEPLGPKLVSDTKLHLIKRKDLAASQEALGAMLGLEEPKVPMTQAKWRDANRLTVTGVEATLERVIGDVVQHKALRAKLIEVGALGAPKIWRP